MSQDTQRDQISKKTVVYTMPGMEAVTVRQHEYRVTDAAAVTMDVYYPSNAGGRTPAADQQWFCAQSSFDLPLRLGWWKYLRNRLQGLIY